MLLHGAGAQLLLLKQVGLILTQVLRTELVGSLMEMAGEFLDDPKVGFYGTLSVITTLEFLQHNSAKMGHRDLLVTHNLSPQSGNHIPVHLTRSVRRTSGFVQTRLCLPISFHSPNHTCHWPETWLEEIRQRVALSGTALPPSGLRDSEEGLNTPNPGSW